MWLVGGGVGACAFLLSIVIDTHVSLESRFAALTKTLHDEMAKQTSVFDARFSRLDERLDKMDARFDAADVWSGKFDERLSVIDARLDALDMRFDGLDTRLGALDALFSAHADRMHEQMLKLNTAIARLDAKTESAQPPPRETTPR